MSPTLEPRYSLIELADLANVTPRTIRYYITQGLLRSPGSVGPGVKYDDTDFARLRLIKRLQSEHQPLAEIRTQLDALGDDSILQMDDSTPEPPRDSALAYIRRVTGPPRAAERSTLYMQIEAAAPAAPTPSTAPAPPAPAPDVRLERSQWERIDLAQDVELHIRRPLVRSTAKRVDRLIAIARDLLEEEPT